MYNNYIGLLGFCVRIREVNETVMIIKTIPRIEPGNILRQTTLAAISDAAFMTNEYLMREYAEDLEIKAPAGKYNKYLKLFKKL